nr:MAG: hypothetical protein CM15mV30_1330 [uncultured marine virus]
MTVDKQGVVKKVRIEQYTNVTDALQMLMI